MTSAGKASIKSSRLGPLLSACGDIRLHKHTIIHMLMALLRSNMPR